MTEVIDGLTGEVLSAEFSPPLKMPADIAKGIVKVMGAVRQLGKDDRNEHGRYDYVSVDKFYAMIGPLMANAGIFLVPFEAEREIVPGRDGKAGWLRTSFDMIMYAAESGDGAFMGRFTVEVAASGPQASASARSFVTKYFERNLFQVPTGDKDDADAQAAEPLPAARAKGRKADPKPDPAKLEGIKKFIVSINEFMDTEPSPEAAIAWEAENATKLKWIRENGIEDASEALARLEAAYEREKACTE